MRPFMLLTLLACVCAPGFAQAPANLAPGPGFEAPPAAETGLPEGWFFVTSEGSTVKPELVGPGFKSAKCLTLKGKCEYAVAGCARTPRQATKGYVAAGWVKAGGEAQGLVKIDYFKGDQWLGQKVVGAVNAEVGDWAEVRVGDEPALYPEATDVAFAFVMTGDGQAWFDDASFAETDKLAAPAGAQPNGTFEDGIGVLPAHWQTANPENEKPTVYWTDKAAHSGQRGVRLKCDQSWFVVVGDPQELDRKKAWTLSGWVRVLSGTAQLKFDFSNDNGYLGQQEFTAEGQPGQWTQLNATLDPTKFADATKVALALVVTGAGSEADFDDVALVAK